MYVFHYQPQTLSSEQTLAIIYRSHIKGGKDCKATKRIDCGRSTVPCGDWLEMIVQGYQLPNYSTVSTGCFARKVLRTQAIGQEGLAIQTKLHTE